MVLPAALTPAAAYATRRVALWTLNRAARWRWHRWTNYFNLTKREFWVSTAASTAAKAAVIVPTYKYMQSRKRAREPSDLDDVRANLQQRFEDAADVNMDDNVGNVQAGGGALGQYRRTKKRSGRRPRGGSIAAQLARTGVQDVIVRYQNMTPYSMYDSASTVSLAHRISPFGQSSTTATAIYPVHLYDITSCPVNTTISGQTPENFRINPAWVLASGPDGNFKWLQCGLRAQNQDGVRSAENARWWMESVRGKSKDIAAIAQFNSDASALTWRDRMYLKWSDIRIQLMGGRANNTKVDCMLVKFKEDVFDPYNNGVTYSRSDQTSFGGTNTNQAANTGLVNVEDQARFNNFWKKTLKPRIFNPLDVVDSKEKDMFKVLSRKRVVFSPDTTTNLDTNRPVVDVRMFHTHNKIFNFTWDEMNNANAPAIQPNVNISNPAAPAPAHEFANTNEMDAPIVQTYPGGASRVHPYVHPNSRTFLLVIGDDWTPKDPAAQGQGTTTWFAQVNAGTVEAPNWMWVDPTSIAEFYDNVTNGYNIIIRNKWLLDRI